MLHYNLAVIDLKSILYYSTAIQPSRIEIDPLICPKCGGTMRIVSFIKDYKVIDKIINHLKLTFKAERPPPTQSIQTMISCRYSCISPYVILLYANHRLRDIMSGPN